MKRLVLVLIGALLAGLLGFTTNAVVAAKMYELRLRVYRDQIMDFRFSSELTRARLMSLIPHRDDHRGELKTAAAESSLFRTPGAIASQEITWFQRIGLQIVNAARQLCLKAGIRVLDETFALARIQSAFFLERNELYPQAAAEFAQLEDHGSLGDEERAFSMVHGAFCHAVQGKIEDAVPRLDRVIREFPGTVFEEDARLILQLLRSAREARERILKAYSTPEERARALFQEGQYAEALKQWKETKEISEEDRYAQAFAMEKTGQGEDAAKRLIELTNSPNVEVAKKSNRRLLMIAYAYSGGDRVKELAERNSLRLGDTQAAAQIKEGAAKLIPFQAVDGRVVDAGSERASRIDSIVHELAPPAVPLPAFLTLVLVDGRLFPAASGQRIGGRFQLELATGAKLTVPFVLVDRITGGAAGLRVEQASGTTVALALKRSSNGFELVGPDNHAAFTAEDFRIQVEPAR